jgi:phage/plasmid-associated DNA primase
MEAKLYLACNELPEIKGEDTALWRRIRVIDFPSRFVDEPNKENENEYKIDKTLPSRMREDITWRQTFVNILLDYYYKDVREPLEVQLKTNEYRDDNNHISCWLDEHITFKEGHILQSKEVYDLLADSIYSTTKINNNKKAKIKYEIQKWIKHKYPSINHIHQDTTFNSSKYKGWLHLDIIQ